MTEESISHSMNGLTSLSKIILDYLCERDPLLAVVYLLNNVKSSDVGQWDDLTLCSQGSKRTTSEMRDIQSEKVRCLSVLDGRSGTDIEFV
jgi:hypothetical protein